MYLFRAAVLAAILLILQVGFDYLQRVRGVTGPALYADEAVLALAFSGVAVFLARRRQIERDRHRLALRSMNHHVRNSLQAILFANYLNNEERQRKHVADSVLRIERAMREISEDSSTEAEEPVRHH